MIINTSDLYDNMSKTDGDAFDVIIKTTDPRPDVTISEDALKELGYAAQAWFASRAVRRLAEGKQAKHVRVRVTVDFDNVAPGEQPYFAFTVDGAHRQEGLRDATN